jgi:transposase-like protein
LTGVSDTALLADTTSAGESALQTKEEKGSDEQLHSWRRAVRCRTRGEPVAEWAVVSRIRREGCRKRELIARAEKRMDGMREVCLQTCQERCICIARVSTYVMCTGKEEVSWTR